jgi:hypothetical protein
MADDNFYSGDSRFPETFEYGSAEHDPAPYDHEGIPFLKANGAHPLDHLSPGLSLNLGDLFGRTQKNAKHIPADHAIPQWIEQRGNQNRNWYSLKDVIGYMKKQRDSSATNKVLYHDRVKQLEKVYSQAKEGVTARRSNGENVPDFNNQAHRNHATFAKRTSYAPFGRPQEVSSAESPDQKEYLGQGTNLENTAQQGRVWPASQAPKRVPTFNPTNPAAPVSTSEDAVSPVVKKEKLFKPAMDKWGK